jgi:hypothetical protein
MWLDNLGAVDDRVRFEALESVLRLTEDRVAWADEAWDEMAAKLEDPNSFQRSIGIMVLCGLAKSAPEARVRETLPLILRHTRDEKFITSRQCLQSVWKLAAAHDSLAGSVLDHLETRFRECVDEPHANLLRRDVIASIRAIYDETHDPAVWNRAAALVSEEPAAKDRKQYEKVLGKL